MPRVREGGRCLCLSLRWPPFSHIHLLWHDWQVVSCQSAQMRRAICLNHTASKAPATHVTRREEGAATMLSTGKEQWESSPSIRALVSHYVWYTLIDLVPSERKLYVDGRVLSGPRPANTTPRVVWEAVFESHFACDVTRRKDVTKKSA